MNYRWVGETSYHMFTIAWKMVDCIRGIMTMNASISWYTMQLVNGFSAVVHCCLIYSASLLLTWRFESLTVFFPTLYWAHLTFNSGRSSACHLDCEKWHLPCGMWEKRNSIPFWLGNDQSNSDSLWMLAISAVNTNWSKAGNVPHIPDYREHLYIYTLHT